MMSQSATPHKLLNDLCGTSLYRFLIFAPLLTFIMLIFDCEYALLSVITALYNLVCVCNVAVPREGNLSEYFLYFVL